LVRERDNQFLQRIAEDYSLNLEELQSKYLAVSEASIKVPRKYKKREAKEVKTTDEAGQSTKCQGITAKKEPCKFSALKGECFCKRHLEKAEGGKAEAPPAPKPVPEVKSAPVVPPAEETEKRLAALLKDALRESESEGESDAEAEEGVEWEEVSHASGCDEEEYEDEE
jgi:type IV secretory pathway VirB10-like protein